MDNSTELLALVFTEELQASQVLERMQQLIDEGQLSVLDLAVLVKYHDGRIGMKDTQDVGPIYGATFGAIVGGLIGAVGGPIGAMIGAVAGATTGGVAARALDFGFPDEYLKELGANLKPGSSVLLVLAKPGWSDRIIAAADPFKGTVIRHVLKEEIGAYLAALGTFNHEQKPPAEMQATLEAQVAAWQTELDALYAKMPSPRTPETCTHLANLRAKQRLAQETLHKLWTNDIEALNRQIEALRISAEAALPEARPAIIAQLETTRTQRRAIRQKLYTQLEARIKGWQVEIEELKARLAAIRSEAEAPVNPRLVALQRFASTFDDPVLPGAETETKGRLAALQAGMEAAAMELQNLYETQIATWQATIADLQAYQTIPGVTDKTEVATRIAELQAQVASTQARLKAHLEAQMSAWRAELDDLQAQILKTETPDQAKIEVQIAALQAQIKDLQAQVAASESPGHNLMREHIARLQDKIAAAQARLQAQK